MFGNHQELPWSGLFQRINSPGSFCPAPETDGMPYDPQHEIWNPFCEQVDSLSAVERADNERGRAWGWYINGGGGDPSHFDYLTWFKNVERQHSR
jgi:hypothetical protein